MAEAQKLLESNCISNHPIQSTRPLQRYHGGKHDTLDFQLEKERGEITTKEERTMKVPKDLHGKSSLCSGRDVSPHTHHDLSRNIAQSPHTSEFAAGMQQRNSDGDQGFDR